MNQVATVALFAELGWQTVTAYDDDLGREHRGQVILRDRLLAALAVLNSDLPAEAFDQALAELERDRSAMALVQANR